jgi:hypothetical protein
MDLLVLSAADFDGTAIASGVTFDVSTDGQPLAVDSLGGVQLPEGPRPLRLKIRVLPPSQFFEVSGTYDYFGPGDLRPVAGLVPADFAPVRGVVDGFSNSVMSLLVYVSRIRDASQETIDAMNGPDRRTEFAAVTDFALQPRAVSVVSTPPIVRNGDLQFSVRALAPAAEVIVFEVKAEPAPKMICVVWPDAVPRTDAAPATPLLVYFHPNAAQNADTHYKGAYPFSFDFPFFGIMTYIRYSRGIAGQANPDPLQNVPAVKGIPYQMDAAGKDLVLVLPVNRVRSEVGVMLKPAPMEMLLKEIIAFMFRKKGVYRQSQIGRTALASFSAGNELVTTFLRASLNSDFATNKLMEVYNFDLPMGFSTGDAAMRAWTSAVSNWAATGNAADKRIRIYQQFNFASFYQQLLGVQPPSRTPYEISSADGNRTAVVAPGDAWARISQDMPKPNGDFQLVHQIIPDLLLTDALRRSGF